MAPEQARPIPTVVRAAGGVAILLALVQTALSLGLTLWSLGKWRDVPGEPGEIGRGSLWLVFGVCAGVALVHLITGAALLCGQRWGRRLAYGGLALAFGALLCGGGVGMAGKTLAEAAAQESGVSFSVEYPVAGPGVSLLAGAVLAVLVSLPEANRWATRRGEWSVPGGVSGPEGELCMQALFSLILAFLPAMMIPQTVSIVLGFIGLARIRQGGGRLRGRWMALTGITVSALLWLLILGVVALVLLLPRLK